MVFNAKKCTLPTSDSGGPFYHKSSINKATIGDGVEVIPERLFSRCSGLTEIEIPNSVTSIGNKAFYSCIRLTKVEIPISVTSIGDYAFSYCHDLSSVTIGESVSSIGDSAFGSCWDLTSVTIPNSVTSIGQNAFDDCERLTSVTIGTSVASIGGGAFNGCNSLETVYYNAKSLSIESDNSGPFYKLSSIKNVTFGNEVEVIPAYLFSNCSNLTSIVFPDNEFSMGRDAFYGTPLTADNTVYFDIPNCIAAGDENGSAFGTSFNSIIFTEKVKTIPAYLAQGVSGLNTVTVPATIERLCEKAFSGSGLTAVYSESTTPVTCAPDAFSGLTATLYIPETATAAQLLNYKKSDGWKGLTISRFSDSAMPSEFLYNGVKYAVKEDGKCEVVRSNYNLQNIIEIAANPSFMGKRLITTALNGNAFKNSSVMNVIIPNTIASIPNQLFYDCKLLTSVEIPNSVTSIGEFAFYNCKLLTSVEIPNSVTSIGSYAFSGLTGSLSIPNSVTEIGNSAFGLCSGLTNVYIWKEKAPSMGYKPFPSNATIEILPFFTGYDKCGATIKKVESAEYNGLKLAIPTTKTGSSSLMVSDDNNGLYVAATQVPEKWQFHWGPEDSGLDYEWTVTGINAGAFDNAYFVPEIILPSTITSLGDRTFADNLFLESVVCQAAVPPTCTSDAISSVESTCTLYVPAGSVDAYKADSQWSKFKTIVGFVKTTVNNIDYMLYGDRLVILGSNDAAQPTDPSAIGQEVTVGGLTRTPSAIGARAFAGSDFGGQFLDINGTDIITVFNGAFEGAQGLTGVNFRYPNSENIALHAPSRAAASTTGVTTIGASAFKNCPDLENVFIPATITSIGSQAFAGTPIKNVVIANPSPNPDDYELSIGSDIFGGCDLSEATLHVPEESLDAYQAADQWKAFGNFATLEDASDILTGIEDIIADGDGNAYGFDPNAEIEYLNLNGIRVSGENLQPGIYILRQGSKTAKILVK